MIPYGRQTIEPDDLEAVVKTLTSDWLTQGPKVFEFEEALATYCGAKYAVVFANGTLALQGAYSAAGLLPDDEVITTPNTFAATANAARNLGAKVVFADIDSETGNIDPIEVGKLITSKTKILAPVDYTGRPVDLEQINILAKKHGLVLVEDACQALGARYKGKKIGVLSDLTVFSFHPVKTITTGEGGAVLTNREDYYRKLKMFVTHGITKDQLVHPSPGAWYFEMQFLAQNARLTDLQCALGLSQLKKADRFVEARRILADYYSEKLSALSEVDVPPANDNIFQSAWHLYVMRLKPEFAPRRADLFNWLRQNDILVQVHHFPAYWHPYYEQLGYPKGLCPKAEEFYNSIISLPLFPSLTKREVDFVVNKIQEFFSKQKN